MNARTIRMPVINVRDKLDIAARCVNGLKGHVMRGPSVVEREPPQAAHPPDIRKSGTFCHLSGRGVITLESGIRIVDLTLSAALESNDHVPVGPGLTVEHADVAWSDAIDSGSALCANLATQPLCLQPRPITGA